MQEDQLKKTQYLIKIFELAMTFLKIILQKRNLPFSFHNSTHFLTPYLCRL